MKVNFLIKMKLMGPAIRLFVAWGLLVTNWAKASAKKK